MRNKILGFFFLIIWFTAGYKLVADQVVFPNFEFWIEIGWIILLPVIAILRWREKRREDAHIEVYKIGNTDTEPIETRNEINTQRGL